MSSSALCPREALVYIVGLRDARRMWLAPHKQGSHVVATLAGVLRYPPGFPRHDGSRKLRFVSK